MKYSFAYPLLGLGMLELSTAGPLHARDEPQYFDPIFPKHTLSARADEKKMGPWPPEIVEFPWPANKSEVANTEAKPEDMPPDAKEKDEELHVRSEISKAFIDKSCNSDQKKKILAAWDEARPLVDAQTNIKEGYRYDIPHTQWLGKDWNSGSSWIPWRKDFRKRNQENWGRLKALFGKSAPKHDYIYFYCTDPEKDCKKSDKAETIAYQWSDPGWFWSNHYINFCPLWERLPTLNDAKNSVKNNKHAQKVMENFQVTRTGALFHEIWHMAKLVSDPRTLDYAYQAQNVWDLAKNKGTWWSTENADSYHMDAVAIHVQQHFKSSMSPVPYNELKSFDEEAFKAVEKPEEKKYITKVLPDKKPLPLPLSIFDQTFPDMKVFDEITYDLWPDTEKPKDDEPKEKTKTLAIATDFMTKLKSAGDLDEFNKLHWKYFQADYGKGAKCRDDTVFDETMDIDRTKAGTYYPKGTKKMKLFDQDCEYTNPGDTPGKLKCGDKEIECIDDPADKDPDDVNAEKGNYPCGDNTTRQPVFICSW